MRSRKSILRFIYTLCVWMTVSIACLWIISGVNPRVSRNSFKQHTSMVVEIDGRNIFINNDRSLSKHFVAAKDNNQQPTTSSNSVTEQTLAVNVDIVDGKRNVKYDRFLSKHLSAVDDGSTFATRINSSNHSVDIDNVKISDAIPTGDKRFNDVTGNAYLIEHGQTTHQTGVDFESKSRDVVFETENVTKHKFPNVKKSHGHSNTPMDTDKTARAKRLPQALIIGVKKCGTRALLEYLRLHPDIEAPGPEPHFFDRYYHLGLDWYREKMPFSTRDKITIEKTPKYFVNSEVPERVHDMSRDTKLIIVVRDPVTRAISDFTQSASRQRYLGSMAFERKAFKHNGTGQVNTHWSGISTGIYVIHLKRWLQYFPFTNVHFVSGENLIRRPAKEMESIQEFLNLTKFINEEHFYFNETKGFPCLKKDKTHEEFQCFNSRKGRPHVNVQNNTIRRLKNFFEPYNKQFYQLTGINFGW